MVQAPRLRMVEMTRRKIVLGLQLAFFSDETWLLPKQVTHILQLLILPDSSASGYRRRQLRAWETIPPSCTLYLGQNGVPSAW